MRKVKCKGCGGTKSSLGKRFCSKSCEMAVRARYKRELKKLQKQLWKKYYK
jgi:hypothetical protein